MRRVLNRPTGKERIPWARSGLGSGTVKSTDSAARSGSPSPALAGLLCRPRAVLASAGCSVDGVRRKTELRLPNRPGPRTSARPWGEGEVHRFEFLTLQSLGHLRLPSLNAHVPCSVSQWLGLGKRASWGVCFIAFPNGSEPEPRDHWGNDGMLPLDILRETLASKESGEVSTVTPRFRLRLVASQLLATGKWQVCGLNRLGWARIVVRHCGVSVQRFL